MNTQKIKTLTEWGAAILLIVWIYFQSPYFNYYHLSPLEAHQQSERTFYYGPSEVVEEVEIGDARIYLGTYKNWFSANMVLKHKGIFWAPGSGVGGHEINKSKDLSYSWSGSSIDKDTMLMRFYGIVTNPEIVDVELDLVEATLNSDSYQKDQINTLSFHLKNHRMFLFHWNMQENNYRQVAIRGLDENGEVVYEEEWP
ncbi:hypothetical protein HNQ94_000957 [Salirhabdus euzebyi]|uniref:DUF5044 domain-containing protein n=1 Tax=Salirhabdus euzebyi TaxID=394506 RepID=A0A841Q263_9BACI|nr:DUF5044 domain-containing protein [Salirhabdus euzebyi]MBB6452512.1 hypothetical protein [Salirhabdus euzebyi]